MKGVFIIAEMGVNHNGNIESAKALIKAAADAGANAVKTQSFKAELIASRSAGMAEYQKSGVPDESQLQMLKKYEITSEMYLEMKDEAEKCGIEMLSSPFDIPSLHELNRIGQRIIKIPSGEITDFPYLVEIGKLKKPVLMSTGMTLLGEISAAIKVLQDNGTTDITLLQCNTQYPTPFEDANLRAMETLKRKFSMPVGYSDHTPGIEAAIAAAALGAVVIEKHFTLDKNMEGPDHKASLEPGELTAMVKAIRNIEKSLGDGFKRASPSEKGNVTVVRKSIVAARNISAGEVFSEENITAKRPGSGVSPMRWPEVLGTKAKRDFAADELIEV